ncbi:hypothetical protein LCGC14_2742910 [marine sediment metagenome]|uniref:Phage tail assembly protein n=1 Tax=marine sediment metagenome TaxID=412755 RepID=A0A0F9BCV8_9ZZZZ
MEEIESKVPKLEIDAKNRIVEQTKEIPLIVNGKKTMITIRKLSTGVRNKIRSECSKTTILGGQPQVKVDELEIQEKILAKAIVKAPFEISVEGIKSLPCEVTDYIFEAYTLFAEPTLKKNLE